MRDASPLPFWLDRPRPDDAAPLDGAAEADLAIVGGGFTGLWAALHAKADDPSRDVVVLEADVVGGGASGRNGGFVVASLTHDLKTPLTAISLNTELLESDRRWEEAGSHPVAAIRRSADRLAGLVDDLLALARTEEGGVAGRAEPGDVSEILRGACRHAEGEAHLRGITFSVDMPEQLPATVDVDALARVYANVVGNAVKFSLPDAEVRLTLRRDGDVVELVCADDGIGITPEDQAAVFDMHRRSDDPLARRALSKRSRATLDARARTFPSRSSRSSPGCSCTAENDS